MDTSLKNSAPSETACPPLLSTVARKMKLPEHSTHNMLPRSDNETSPSLFIPGWYIPHAYINV